MRADPFFGRPGRRFGRRLDILTPAMVAFLPIALAAAGSGTVRTPRRHGRQARSILVRIRTLMIGSLLSGVIAFIGPRNSFLRRALASHPVFSPDLQAPFELAHCCPHDGGRCRPRHSSRRSASRALAVRCTSRRLRTCFESRSCLRRASAWSSVGPPAPVFAPARPPDGLGQSARGTIGAARLAVTRAVDRRRR